jgi:hypothetical protein
MIQTKPIKASLGFKKSSANDVLNRANAVKDGVFADKDDYSNPPVDEATLKSQIDALSAGIAAAMDGGKKAVVAREHQKGSSHQVIASTRTLRRGELQGQHADFSEERLPAGVHGTHYSRAAVGFDPHDPAENSGQMLVSLVARPSALSYQLHWAPVGPGGTLGNWTEQPVGKMRSPALVTGLTPGTAYVFQVRAVTKSGYTDWSESVTRICT